MTTTANPDTTGPNALSALLGHIEQVPLPFVLKYDGQRPTWNDTDRHQAAQTDTATYTLLGLLESTPVGQRGRLLFESLTRSREGQTVEERTRQDRAIHALLRALDADTVLTVFLTLRRVRANHKHVTRTILAYLLNHAEAADLWVRRRPAVTDVLEHAVGKNVLRAAVRYAALGAEAAPEQKTYLRRAVLRYASDAEWATELLRLLAISGEEAAKATREQPAYQTAHQSFAEALTLRKERPSVITAENRGEIAAALTALYRQETRAGLQEQFRKGLSQVAEYCPQFAGKVALILDASASLAGYGDRKFCCLAQSVALRLVLGHCAPNLTVYTVGTGSTIDEAGAVPLPGGATDLAMALLDALDQHPDLVLIVSDGYENRCTGDLARVLATLPQLGIQTPIIFCHTKFTGQDDLTLRQPTRGLVPEMGFWHEADFPEFMLRAFVRTGQSEETLRSFLWDRLNTVEKVWKS